MGRSPYDSCAESFFFGIPGPEGIQGLWPELRGDVR